MVSFHWRGYRIAPLCDDNGESLNYDFSPYDRLNYENLIGGAPIEMVGTWELAWTEVGILGWIVSIIMASAALFCGIGLGLSAAFRKKGKSKLSFAVQFAGVGGIGLTGILFFLFYGNLLRPLN